MTLKKQKKKLKKFKINNKFIYLISPNKIKNKNFYNQLIDILKLKKIINKLNEHGVFHVVLSGGEPLSNYEVLREALKILNEKKINFFLLMNQWLTNYFCLDIACDI